MHVKDEVAEAQDFCPFVCKKYVNGNALIIVKKICHVVVVFEFPSCYRSTSPPEEPSLKG